MAVVIISTDFQIKEELCLEPLVRMMIGVNDLLFPGQRFTIN